MVLSKEAVSIEIVGLYKIESCFTVHRIISDENPYKLHRIAFENEELNTLIRVYQVDFCELNEGQIHGNTQGIVDWDVLYEREENTSEMLCLFLIEVEDYYITSRKTLILDLVCSKKDEYQIIYKEKDYNRRISLCLNELSKFVYKPYDYIQRLLKANSKMYGEIPLRFFKNKDDCFKEFLHLHNAPQSTLMDVENFINYFKKKYKLEKDTRLCEKALDALIDFLMFLRRKREPSDSQSEHEKLYPAVKDYAVCIEKYVWIILSCDSHLCIEKELNNPDKTYKFYDSDNVLIDFDVEKVKTFIGRILIPLKDLIEKNVHYLDVDLKSTSFKKIKIFDYINSEEKKGLK